MKNFIANLKHDRELLIDGFDLMEIIPIINECVPGVTYQLYPEMILNKEVRWIIRFRANKLEMLLIIAGLVNYDVWINNSSIFKRFKGYERL